MSRAACCEQPSTRAKASCRPGPAPSGQNKQPTANGYRSTIRGSHRMHPTFEQSFAELLKNLESRQGAEGWPAGFDPETWLRGWVERPQSALGWQRPCDLMSTEEGYESVRRVFGAIWSGAYV
ncbi:DUF2384 domain-containing protein [Luteimonas yindakuii]|uniref:MbcA/ParS/Xre antitoxin family protein n=1 Tax=Luteimonas yindakuii TaxID=2565782 RepID=UPI0010A563B9|nr:DUF2384 domain-containing protein [Luteimonas yindakuii]